MHSPNGRLWSQAVSKMFSMIKIGLFLRRFSVVDFSAVGFLDLLKTLKTQLQKSLFLRISLIFTDKAMHFYGLISKLMVYLSRKKAKNYFTTRDLFISAMSHVKLIKDCCVLIRLSPDKNWRAKEGWKGKKGKTALNLPSLPFQWSLALRHQSLAFRARLFSKPCKKRSACMRRRLDRGDTRLYLPLNIKSMERLFNTVFRTFSQKNK